VASTAGYLQPGASKTVRQRQRTTAKTVGGPKVRWSAQTHSFTVFPPFLGEGGPRRLGGDEVERTTYESTLSPP
jgi:hypothetical protein